MSEAESVVELKKAVMRISLKRGQLKYCHINLHNTEEVKSIDIDKRTLDKYIQRSAAVKRKINSRNASRRKAEKEQA